MQDASVKGLKLLGFGSAHSNKQFLNRKTISQSNYLFEDTGINTTDFLSYV